MRKIYLMMDAAKDRASVTKDSITLLAVSIYEDAIVPKFNFVIHFFHTTTARIKMSGRVGRMCRMPILRGLCILYPQ